MKSTGSCHTSHEIDRALSVSVAGPALGGHDLPTSRADNRSRCSSVTEPFWLKTYMNGIDSSSLARTSS